MRAQHSGCTRRTSADPTGISILYKQRTVATGQLQTGQQESSRQRSRLSLSWLPNRGTTDVLQLGWVAASPAAAQTTKANKHAGGGQHQQHFPCRAHDTTAQQQHDSPRQSNRHTLTSLSQRAQHTHHTTATSKQQEA